MQVCVDWGNSFLSIGLSFFFLSVAHTGALGVKPNGAMRWGSPRAVWECNQVYLVVCLGLAGAGNLDWGQGTGGLIGLSFGFWVSSNVSHVSNGRINV